MKAITKDQMTADQIACYRLMCDVLGGEHHLTGHCGPIGIKNNGLRFAGLRQNFATFDGCLLTNLLVLAHDRCIRVEVSPGGSRSVAFMLFKRRGRSGKMYERHPTIESAIAEVREYFPEIAAQEADEPEVHDDQPTAQRSDPR